MRSTDGGSTWSIVSDWLPLPSRGIDLDYIHADFHALAVGTDGAFYAGTDGGFFTSADARTGATPVFSSTQNRGLVSHLAYSVACAPESWPAALQGWMGGGMQDNGTRVRAGDTTTFNQVFGGDGIGLAVSRSTATLQDGTVVPQLLLASAEFLLV